MTNDLFAWEKFLMLPVIGIIRQIAMEDVKQILPRYYEAGLNTVEITLNTDNAEDMIRYASEQFRGRLNIGAGTVCTLGDLRKALNAGAQFIVSPILDEEVITFCVKRKVPVFPGAYSPNEIYKAWNLGASMVKVFPASSLGPKYIHEVKGPLNQIKLIPTGGINIDNCVEFLNAGADALGIGGELFDKKTISEENWDALSAHFEKLVDKISVR
jgi:2-dehydro-3-deoxyphosphogluconate aldolase / (4S)-4-hydroxy-2-oxoglutarate aldolase